MYATIERLYEIFTHHPRITTDSRKISRGDLFFALKGDRFDGNDYALMALEKGASYAVVDRPDLASSSRCVLVRDALSALQELASYHRARFDIPVVGITGTNGKTTTKELTLSVLSQAYQVLATEGNLNNHIGVPLTLLRLTPQDQVAIIEMGASARGEIEALARIAKPTIALVTNVGRAHLEGFGSIQGVLDTKSELPSYVLEHGGTFLLAQDDPLLNERWHTKSTYTYGTQGGYVRGQVLDSTPFLSVMWEGREVKTHLVGTYNLSNVLASIACGTLLGLDAEKIVAGIEAYTPTNNRSQLLYSQSGHAIIVDAYNANPSSMMASLSNLRDTPAKYKVAILGDMLELGEETREEHERIVEEILSSSEIHPILCGKAFQEIGLQKGLPSFPSVSELISYLSTLSLPPSTLLLLKGSRGIALEKCLPTLLLK